MTTVPNLLAEQTEDMVDDQRIIFIREAAIHIYSLNRGLSTRDAWVEAERLWETKPEDC